MQNRWRIAVFAGILCFAGALGCITTTPAPPPPGYNVPCCPPTSYQPPTACAPAAVSTGSSTGICAQGWQPATTPR